MNTRYQLMLSATMLVAIAASASGGTVTSMYSATGLGLSIPDNGYDGTLSSMASATLAVPSIGADTIESMTVQVAIQHEWVGDLVIKLLSPEGTLVELVSRAGFDEPADDGTACCGDSSDLDFDFPITFDDAAAMSSEDMGTGLGGKDIIGSDGVIAFHSSGFLGTHGLLGLAGESAVGEWTLYLGDAAGSQEGKLSDFKLTITTVPAPGAFALTACAGMLGIRRRRA